MANYNIVVDASNFKPFTYDELVKPLILYRNERESRELAYLDLLELTLSLSDIDPETDPEAYKAYTDYTNSVLSVSDDMQRNGLTVLNSLVFNLRKKYMLNIKPLKDALNTRNELAKELRLKNDDGTNFYSVDYGNMSLEDVRKQKTHTYKTINGNKVRTIFAETFAPLALLILNSPEFRTKYGDLYFEERILKGYTLADFLSELRNTNEGGVLAELFNKTFSSLDLKDFSEDQKALIRAFAESGATRALGATEYNNMANRGYMDAATAYNYRLKMAEDRFQWLYDSQGNIIGPTAEYIKSLKLKNEQQLGGIEYGGKHYEILGTRSSGFKVKELETGRILDPIDPVAETLRQIYNGDPEFRPRSEGTRKLKPPYEEYKRQLLEALGSSELEENLGSGSSENSNTQSEQRRSITAGKGKK